MNIKTNAPTGFVLVPAEATDAMRAAGGRVNSEWLNDNAPIGEARYVMPMIGVWRAMIEAAPTAGTVPPVRPQAVPDAQPRLGFEWWDRLCKLPTFSFLSPAEGGVVRVSDSSGDWIEKHAAQKIVDGAQAEINLTRERLERLALTIAAQTTAQSADAQDVSRLVEHVAYLSVALREEEKDAAVESWRSLPQHLQDAITAQEEIIDAASTHGGAAS